MSGVLVKNPRGGKSALPRARGLAMGLRAFAHCVGLSA